MIFDEQLREEKKILTDKPKLLILRKYHYTYDMTFLYDPENHFRGYFLGKPQFLKIWTSSNADSSLHAHF